MNSSSPLPQRISKYEIKCLLGSGAMGIVYKGYDNQIERSVAIKVLHDHLREGENGKDLETRFVQEAKAAARCLHPNIVTIFDFGSDGSPYIVMEYVKGIELRAHLKSDTFIALHSATDITIQILKALGHAHGKGVVHRDIKPANIILLENGNIKVSDFGVARLDTSNLTSTGFMVGTPNYMSPEGLLGQQVDARSDLYSVGVLFFELLSRNRPSREKSLDESLDSLSQVSHLSPQNILSIKPILRRALQHNPDDRYQSVEEFIKDLQSIDDMDLTLATVAYFPRPDNYDVNAPVAVSNYSSSQWSDEFLSSLEHSLVQYVGPMAKLLVRKSSRSTNSIDELVANLTHYIPNENERSQFIKTMRRSDISQVTSFSTPDTRASTPEQPAQTLSEGISDTRKQELTKVLAFYAGPLASRLVNKMSKQYADFDQVVSELGRHISDDHERNEFFIKAHKL